MEDCGHGAKANASVDCGGSFGIIRPSFRSTPLGRIMDPEETIGTGSRTVCCDGGGEPHGHPAVYLKIGDEGAIVCPYCSRRYILDKDADQAVSH